MAALQALRKTRNFRFFLTACVALAGCAGTPPGVFRSDRSSPLLDAPPLQQAAGGGLWVAPISGAEAETEGFRRELAKALVARDVPAGVDRPGPRSLVLASTAGTPTAAGRGFVDVAWRLTGPDGGVLDDFIGRAPLDFRVERPETKAAVAAIADRMAGLLAPPDQAVADTAIAVAVPPAETQGFEDGAPLARAMTAALAGQGFRVAAAPEAATAVVRASASVTPTPERPGLAAVAIRWAVTTPDGREVGAADQKNFLPKELAGDGLAAIAADAAAAAAESVAGLIRLAAREKSPSTTKGAS